jgi:transglutaminase-like putative cysteine protease
MTKANNRMPFLKDCRFALLCLTVVFSAAAFTESAQAGCDLQIVSAGPCLADSTSGVPNVGEAYGLKVTFNVIGTPLQPFRIKWTLANVTNYFDDINVGPGDGYWWYFVWWVNLDDPIPWSVTLDPDGVSGDTNLNNTASGTFTPIPPTTMAELYAPRLMHGSETSILNFQPGSGTIGNLWVFFGLPTSHGAQQAISVSAPANAQTIVTAPYGLPLFEIARTNAPAAIFQDSTSFVVQLSNMRVNPTLLRTVTWAEMNSLTTNWTQWLDPDPTCESTNSAITNFVQQSLPTNYQATLTPYDTARTLHRAVMKKLTYQSPPLHGDAVNVLQDGVADCGGFSSLLTACLRCAGIPARPICGFWQGDSQWHVRVEFHLAGVDWVVADPTLGNGADPTGTYAYEFGDVPDANQYLAMDVGEQHWMLNNDFGGIQVPNWWWTGGATFNSYTALSYLQPNGVLSLTNSSNGSFQFYLTDVPTEGSVVVQTSTNLTAWSPLATNSANGSVINYAFPITGEQSRFYRANVIP